jgi:hypothetical protein
MMDSRWIVFEGRRDPGAPAPAVVPRSVSVARATHSIARELAVAGLVLGVLAVLRLGSTFVQPSGSNTPSEDVYAAVVHAHGEVRPFSNAVHAEARHAAFLERVLAARGVAVPPRALAPAQPAPASLTQACAAAVASERHNVALYDRLLAGGSLPEDVRRAFDHNRWASLEHHLPAFERCRGAAAAGVGE